MRNRILEFWPPSRGDDGAWLNMAKGTAKRSAGFASKEHELFAARFAQELSRWLAVDSARTKRQFADFCGTDDRLIQRWENEGVGKMDVTPGSILAHASGFLGVKPSSWWGSAIIRVDAVKTPSPLDADIAAALVTHARREAFVNATFRRELQELLERHRDQN
jgi:hypothetical protein